MTKPKPEPVERASPDEDEFAVAMRNVLPISAKGRAIAPRPELRPARRLHEDTLEDFMAGKLEFAISGTDEYLEGHVVGLDELILNRLREGQFSPEAHYDLHGLNSEQAFESLKEFIHTAWLKDLRSVLVITGRGKNSPAGQSVLRQKLQNWLTREPFKRVVLAFCTAKPHDGVRAAYIYFCADFAKKGRYSGKGNLSRAISIEKQRGENENIAIFYVLLSGCHAGFRCRQRPRPDDR